MHSNTINCSSWLASDSSIYSCSTSFVPLLPFLIPVVFVFFLIFFTSTSESCTSGIVKMCFSSTIFLIQSFVLQSNLQLLWILVDIHWHDRFSSLNMIKSGSEVPSVQTYPIAVTHSWHPDFAWNAWRIITLIIHCEASISPIANPLSFILYRFPDSILYSLIMFCKFSNHFVNHSMDTSLTLTVSISFLLTLTNWGWYDINRGIQSLSKIS